MEVALDVVAVGDDDAVVALHPGVVLETRFGDAMPGRWPPRVRS